MSSYAIWEKLCIVKKFHSQITNLYYKIFNVSWSYFCVSEKRIRQIFTIHFQRRRHRDIVNYRKEKKIYSLSSTYLPSCLDIVRSQNWKFFLKGNFVVWPSPTLCLPLSLSFTGFCFLLTLFGWWKWMTKLSLFNFFFSVDFSTWKTVYIQLFFTKSTWIWFLKWLFH